jgi:REP element-mobilizing transposase RayT
MFITTNTKDRHPIFGQPACAREAIEAMYRVQIFNPFFLHGFVIMPDHCHFLVTVPEPGSISRIMQSYKRAVSFGISLGPIWQSRFHQKIPTKPEKVLQYIHQNPVKAGLCKNPDDYPWSSASGKWDVMDLDVW